ncbi:MAG: aspartate 1-decarboxylase [Bacillota bacterium]|nr:MAG: aspartate 1-decarboxylase [Bacillota bacterium]
MLRTFFKAKIHRATVTEANLNYEGSCTIDTDLLAAAGILPYECITVVNVTTGARFETYVIPGPAGSGIVCMNGGAARLAQPGDLVIVITWAQLTPEEIPGFRPRVVRVDGRNRILDVHENPPVGDLVPVVS